MDAKQLLVEALRLPEAERAALAGGLSESLEVEDGADAEAAWSAEIHRRVEDLTAWRAQTVPWAEARRRIRLAAEGGRRPIRGGSTRDDRLASLVEQVQAHLLPVHATAQAAAPVAVDDIDKHAQQQPDPEPLPR